jgi:hypothetical protein
MPVRPVFLREARPVADHPLDKVVGHRQPVLRPALEPAEVAVPQSRRGQDRNDEQGHVAHAAGADTQDDASHDQLDDRRDSQEPSAERHRFKDPGFHHSTQELTDSEVAHLVGFEVEGSDQEPAFEDGPAADRELTPGGGRKQSDRDQGQEQEEPGPEPAGIEAARQGQGTEEPPGEDPEQLRGYLRDQESRQKARETRLARLGREGSRAGGTDEPEAADLRPTQVLPEQRPPDALPTSPA